MKHFFAFWVLAFILAVSLPAVGSGKQRNWNALHSGGLRFTANKGQVINSTGKPENAVLYVGDAGSGTTIYFQKNKISYVQMKVKGLQEEEENEKEEEAERMKPGYNAVKELVEKLGKVTRRLHKVDIEFLNADPNVQVVEEEQTNDYTNYYFPQCKDGATAKSFKKIVYKNIYPGIDIVFKGHSKSGLEYDFIVHPGGNPHDINVKYTGADDIKLKGQTLVIKTSIGEIEERIPESYQTINGEKVLTKTRYVLRDQRSDDSKQGSDGGFDLSYQVSNYDPAFPLTIDPWATFYGGSGSDYGYAMTTDPSNNVLVTGYASSPDFPISAGAYQTKIAGDPLYGDAFVLKFDPNGTRLWATFYGGEHAEYGQGIGSDNNRNVLVTGYTTSSAFPVTAGAVQSALAVGATREDAFILKLDPNGFRSYASYYGGKNTEYAVGITSDNNRNIVLTGTTSSVDFPVTTGAFQSKLKGTDDVFIVKLDETGNRLWATYFGSPGGAGWGFAESVNGISTDGGRNVIISGSTTSNTFPASPGAFQGVLKGSSDAFIAKFNENGGRVFSTYFGGLGSEYTIPVAVDHSDNIVFTGVTGSSNFPVTPGVFDTKFKGAGWYSETFVAKLSPAGGLVWGTFFNAQDDCEGAAIGVDAGDNIYITGAAENTDMPVTSCAFQTVNNGGENFFLARFDPTGNIICATYMGWERTECFGYQSLAVGGNSVNLLMYGTDTLPTSANAFQDTVNGPWENTYIIQVNSTTCGVLSSVFYADTLQYCYSGATSVDFFSTASSFYSGSISYDWSFPGGTPATSSLANPTNIVYTTAGEYNVKLKVSNACDVDSTEQPNYIGIYTPTSIIPPHDTNICIGNVIPLTATSSSGSGGTYYNWSPAYGINPNHGASVMCGAQTSITYTISGTCGERAVVNVGVWNLPTITLTPSTSACIRGAFNLTASGSNYYSWSPATFLDATTGSSVITTANIPIAYSVKSIDLNGCASLPKGINLYPLPDPYFSALPLAGCKPLLVNFKDTTASTIVTWKWKFGDAGTATTKNPAHTYLSSGIYTVKLIVTDNNTCKDSLTKPAYITVYTDPRPEFAFTPQPTNIVDPTITFADETTSDYPDPMANWNWDFGDGNGTSAIQSPVYVYPDSGNFVVRLIVIDVHGCMDTVYHTLRISPQDLLFIPNSFSPNGDNINELYQLFAFGLTSYDLKIFDRWGNLVFKSNTIDQSWDGKIHGNVALEDVYTYQLDATFFDKRIDHRVGMIVLAR